MLIYIYIYTHTHTHTHKVTLLGNKKEWNTDTCYNKDEAQKNPAKYKKTRHIVPHLTRKDKYVKRESRKAVPWAGGGNKD